jgi:hypothetical protein
MCHGHDHGLELLLVPPLDLQAGCGRIALALTVEFS